MQAQKYRHPYKTLAQQHNIDNFYTMLLFSIAIIIGLVLLIWSADKFVSGAVATALNLGMTPMMIGLTVVAFGTSAPELIVSATAALDNVSHLAVGNAIGSNIANIALVLGATALVSAIPLRKEILKVEFPVLIAATGLASILLYDGTLETLDGVALAVILLISLIALHKLQNAPISDIDEIEDNRSISANKAYALLAISILFLLGSSKLLVWGAVGIATELGVSNLIIGLTIVAIGTSLPELAASIASALKGHHDLALGNIIGSNLFNLLAVLAIPAILHPSSEGGIALSDTTLYRDYALMLALTVGLAAIVYFKHAIKKDHMGKAAGTALLAVYIGYLYVLYDAAVAI